MPYLKNVAGEPEWGWRLRQPSAARSKHRLNVEGTGFFCVPKKKPALTSVHIAAAPLAWPPKLKKALMALPECSFCVAKVKAEASPQTHKAKRERVEMLEAQLDTYEKALREIRDSGGDDSYRIAVDVLGESVDWKLKL